MKSETRNSKFETNLKQQIPNPNSVLSVSSVACNDSIQNPQSKIQNDLIGDERGQALLFAAASIMILVGFIAVVYNLGQITERRTEIQVAADNAVYSGAMVQANALSTIAWMNNGMAQVYQTMVRYSVDVCATSVPAMIEERIHEPGPKCQAYADAYDRATVGIPMCEEWLTDLSRIERAVALLTPRLMEEAMFDAAKAGGAERISIYPTSRLFPPQGELGHSRFRIEQFPQGWRITNLDDGEMLWVFKLPHEWDIIYSNNGITQEKVVISETDPGKRLVIQRYDASGQLVQVITIIKTDNLGWIVLGSAPNGNGINLTFTPVDMDGDGIKEGTEISDGQGHTLIVKNQDGQIFIWDRDRNGYISMTTEQTTIGGIPIHINVSNVIEFPGASIYVGDPTTVDIGHAHIVLTDPPIIETGIGPVVITVHGFDPSSCSVSVNGFTLNLNSADGRWRKYYDPEQDLWWRHRLVSQKPVDFAALRQWEYDWEVLGALLQDERTRGTADDPGPMSKRFAVDNGLVPRYGPPGEWPEWVNWYSVIEGRPITLATQHFTGPPDHSGLYHPDEPIPPNSYYHTIRCPICKGTGYLEQGRCWACMARDYNGDGSTEIRVFLGDIGGFLAGCLSGGLQGNMALPVSTFPKPLVLPDEFFKYGVNVAAWRGAEQTPMIFKNEPPWGFVASASARVGVPQDGRDYLYQFADLPGGFDSQGRDVRQQWCEFRPENLYRTNLDVALWACRKTIDEYDLEHNVPGAAVPDESGLSYLMDALMLSRYSELDEPSTWVSDYGGRTDRNIPGLLSNMRNRKGAVFDLRNASNLDQVVLH